MSVLYTHTHRWYVRELTVHCRLEGKRPINVMSVDYHTSTESLEASATKEALAAQDPPPQPPAQQRLEAEV